MAEQINTIRKVLEELNKGQGGPWAEIPGFFAISKGKVEDKTIGTEKKSMALKAFVNTQTGEVKTYVSKWLDEPGTTDLV